MKSAPVSELELAYPYTHKLIYVDVTSEHREALAIFNLEGEGIEAFEAEKKAKRRLANLIFYSVYENASFQIILKELVNPRNIRITDNVRAVNVRLASSLKDYDPDMEIQYHWRFNNVNLLKPFCGGFGVIPESTPYTISSRKESPIFYRIISTTEDLDG